jgi:uncharacterized protein
MNGPALLALQEIDSALDRVANRRARLPEVLILAGVTAEADEHRRRQATARRRGDDAQALIEASEKASSEITAKRARLEQQLRTVTTTRQADALEHEIGTLNQERNALDDQELAAMDEAAAAEEELARLDAGEPEMTAAVVGAQAALDAANGALDAERDELLARRDPASAALGAEELALYARLRARHDGVGIAVLEGQRCSGCHLDLSRAEVDTIRAFPAGTLADCPQCGRVLVVP